MIPFDTEFARLLSTSLSKIPDPSISEILDTMKHLCVELELADRDDIGMYSIMAELCPYDGKIVFLLQVYFNMCLDEAGKRIDDNDSVVVDIELDLTQELEELSGDVEYGADWGDLEDCFRLVSEWATFQKLKDERIRYAIAGGGLP